MPELRPRRLYAAGSGHRLWRDRLVIGRAFAPFVSSVVTLRAPVGRGILVIGDVVVRVYQTGRDDAGRADHLGGLKGVCLVEHVAPDAVYGPVGRYQDPSTVVDAVRCQHLPGNEEIAGRSRPDGACCG